MVARLALLVAALLPMVASAQAPTRQEAEDCERQHRRTDEAATCGGLYMALYNANPGDPHGDELLYNAAVSYVDGKAYAAALTALGLLRTYYPRGKLAMRATAYAAKLYGDIAMYDRAADLLEEYAKKYAGEKDAYAAMSDAIYYRTALGDDDKAIDNTRYFVKTYGTRKPADAANAYFALTSIYEKRRDTDSVVKHLRDYIRLYGSKGGTNRLVIAHAKIGEALWQQSCPVTSTDGTCARVKRTKPVCGDAVKLEPLKRDAKDVTAAQQAFEQAVKAYAKLTEDDPVARYYVARAQLGLADIDALTNTSASRVATYESILALKDPATSIVAAGRIARALDAEAALVATKSGCAAAAPLRERAKLAYGVCLAKATELSWFDDQGGRACERALTRLDPTSVPPLRERIGSVQTNLVLATENLR